MPWTREQSHQSQQNTQTLRAHNTNPGSDLSNSLPQLTTLNSCHTALLQPHQKTPLLREQQPTLGFSLLTNTGCTFTRKSLPRQFLYSSLKPMGTQQRQRAAFLQDPRDTCTLQGTDLPPACHPNSLIASLDLTDQHRAAREAHHDENRSPKPHPSWLQHSQLCCPHSHVPAQPALRKEMQSRMWPRSSGTTCLG